MLTRMLERAMTKVVVKHADLLTHTTPTAVTARVDRLGKMRGMVLQVGLNKLFAEKYFSFCQLEALMRAAGVHGSDGVLRVLRPLHCIDWADMPRELQEEVTHHVLAIFEDAR